MKPLFKICFVLLTMVILFSATGCSVNGQAKMDIKKSIATKHDKRLSFVSDSLKNEYNVKLNQKISKADSSAAYNMIKQLEKSIHKADAIIRKHDRGKTTRTIITGILALAGPIASGTVDDGNPKDWTTGTISALPLAVTLIYDNLYKSEEKAKMEKFMALAFAAIRQWQLTEEPKNSDFVELKKKFIDLWEEYSMLFKDQP